MITWQEMRTYLEKRKLFGQQLIYFKENVREEIHKGKIIPSTFLIVLY